MRELIKIILITCTIVLVGYAQSYNINALRDMQKNDLLNNEKDFLQKAQEYKVKGEYTDAKKKELLEQYSQKKSEIVESYKKIDKQREVMIEQTLHDIGDGIDNTGSMPKNVNADVDYVANTQEGYDQVRQKWQERGDNLEIYNHDDPKDYKTVNNSTDEVVWKEDSSLTKAQIEAKNLDHDAYVTTGGKKSTGVRGANVKSSDSGAGLDPMRKLVFGIENNNLKDIGKSLVKVTTQADGVDVVTRNKKDKLVIQKELDQKHIKNNEILQKASDLKNYKDQYESKIVDLGDSSDVATKKLNDFKKDALILAVEKQAKLDIANQRKERISQMLIESLPDGSPTKRNVEQRLKDSREANQLAREQITTSLNNIIEKNPADGFEQIQLASQDQIREIESTQYQQKEMTREVEKNKILEDGKKRQAKVNSKTTKTTKKLNVSGTGVVSFLVEAYQFEDSADNIIKSGGNEFVTIDKNDTQLEKNIKAYTGAAIDSTTFGGAWNAGKRADEEEKQRIQDALKKGKVVNPVLSWARASFWGLYYVTKENVVGTFESAKDTLVQIDQEIKEQIKDSVSRKYAKNIQEESEKLLEEKKKELVNSIELKKQKIEEVLEKDSEVIEIPRRKKVVFFEENNVNSELAYMKEIDRDKDREARADNAKINSEEKAYVNNVIASRQALAEGFQSLATGMAAVKSQMDAQDRAFEAQVKANRENVNQVMYEANQQYLARQNNPNSTMNLLKKEAQDFQTGYTMQQHQSNIQNKKPIFVANNTITSSNTSSNQTYTTAQSSSSSKKATKMYYWAVVKLNFDYNVNYDEDSNNRSTVVESCQVISLDTDRIPYNQVGVYNEVGKKHGKVWVGSFRAIKRVDSQNWCSSSSDFTKKDIIRGYSTGYDGFGFDQGLNLQKVLTNQY